VLACAAIGVHLLRLINRQSRLTYSTLLCAQKMFALETGYKQAPTGEVCREIHEAFQQTLQHPFFKSSYTFEGAKYHICLVSYLKLFIKESFSS
jgi:hypothetical protein